MSINYGAIAIDTAQLCRTRQLKGDRISPQNAWEQIETEMGIDSPCEAAKCAFMRLCSGGCVTNIPQRNFRSLNHELSDHGAGTIEALGCLRRCSSLADNKQGLFNAGTVQSYLHSADSGELDVLLALWNHNDIAEPE